jgi:hypothetical protein
VEHVERHLFRIVRRGDHDADGLSIELLATKGSEHADPEEHRVEDVRATWISEKCLNGVCD